MLHSLFKPRSGEDEKGGARLWLIIFAALAGVLLLVFGGRIEKKETASAEDRYTVDTDEMVLYQSYLEERIRTLCQSVKGVGEVSAVVTLHGGYESVYATQLKNGDEVYVIVGSGSSAEPLLITRNAPEIAGIGIVCHGAGNAEVRRELTSLLSAAFDLPSNRIYITELAR